MSRPNPNSGPPQVAPIASSSSANTSSARYTDYRLKSTSTDLLHNVMILNTPNVSLADFTPPIRLVRELSAGTSSPTIAAPYLKNEVTAGRSKKQRTRILYTEANSDAVALRLQESVPWLLEDVDAQHSCIGRLEGGQHSNYVFFVNQGNEFRVIPAAKWYKFGQRLAFQPLSLEEAEVRMAARKRDDIDRWMMHHQRKQEAGEAEREEEDKDGNAGVSGPSKGQKTISVKKSLMKTFGRNADTNIPKVALFTHRRSMANEKEEVDFDEIFDDDEGAELLEDDENEGDAALKRSKVSLSLAGREMKRLVRQLDKSNYYDSDEERDPYAGVEEVASDSEDEQPATSTGSALTSAAATATNAMKVAPKAMATSQKSETMTLSLPKIVINPPSSPKSPIPSAPSSPGTKPAASLSSSKRTGPPSVASSSPKKPRLQRTAPAILANQSNAIESTESITEAEVIAHLRSGPMTTRSLIGPFKRRIKADPDNKAAFKAILKKVTVFKAPLPETTAKVTKEDEKMIDLKDEYKI